MNRALARLLLISALLSGCQLLPGTRHALPPLLPPSDSGLDLQASQRLSLQRGEREQQLLAVLSISPARLQLTGLSAQGQRLLDIDYDGQTLNSRQHQPLPSPLSAEWILLQLQLAYWPLASLQRAWSEPWQVTASAGQRTLQLEQQPLITVTYRPLPEPGAADSALEAAVHQSPAAQQAQPPNQREQVVIVHPTLNLRLTIDTLQVRHTTSTGSGAGSE